MPFSSSLPSSYLKLSNISEDDSKQVISSIHSNVQLLYSITEAIVFYRSRRRCLPRILKSLLTEGDLPHCSEIWGIINAEQLQLEGFQHKSLRRILKISYMIRVTNEDVKRRRGRGQWREKARNGIQHHGRDGESCLKVRYRLATVVGRHFRNTGSDSEPFKHVDAC